MIARAYIDDSGSGLDTGTLLLAGFLGTEKGWCRLVPRWKEALAQDPPLSGWHMSHANMLNKEYGGWSKRQVGLRLEQLCTIILEETVCHFTVAMKPEDYESIVKGKVPAEQDHPYYACTVCAMTGLMKLRAEFEIERLEVVFDFQQQHKPMMERGIELGLRSILTPEENANLKVEIPQSRIEDRYIPLQAADILAWHQHRAARSHIGRTKRAHRRLVEKCPERCRHFLADERFLRGWAASFKRAGAT